MRIDLQAIHFNHNADSTVTGAFSIRRNESVPVVLPEWRKDKCFRPEDAAAAYVLNYVNNLAEITIHAEFSCDDPAVTKMLVRALDGHVNPVNVLGFIGETEVEFVNGRADVPLVVSEARIRDLGVNVSDLIWNWQFSLDGDDWQDLATTLHRIYTVIDMPAAPWEPTSRVITNTQLPWTEVLDFSCRVAASTTTLDDAATKITHWTNSLGGGFVRYDNLGGGWTGFTLENPSRFDCSEFLLLLNGGQNLQGPAVNCDDCAAVVTSFSNILGCRLSEGGMGGNQSFDLNLHRRIGLDGFFKSSFSRHSVGWLGECGEEDPLFDGCVQVNFNGNPGQAVFAVATNIRFSEYRPLLSPDDVNCAPMGKRPLRRIGLALPPVIDVFESVASASTSYTSSLTIADVGWASAMLSHVEDSQNLMLIGFRCLDTTNAKYLLQSFWRRRHEPDVSFGIDTFECNSSDEVAEVRDSLLFRFNRPDLMSIENPPFGTEAYTVKDGSAILFIRNNYVFLVRNTGKRHRVSCEGLATLIDGFIV